MYVYTVSIKRKFLPGYKRYSVVSHWHQFGVGQNALIRPRLILELANGDEVAISDILNRDFIVHSDFKLVKAKKAEEAKAQAEKRDFEEFKALKARTDTPAVFEEAPAAVIPIPKQA